MTGWWLSVEPPLKNMRQLGIWHSQYDGKHKSHVPNHQPDDVNVGKAIINAYGLMLVYPSHKKWVQRKTYENNLVVQMASTGPPLRIYLPRIAFSTSAACQTKSCALVREGRLWLQNLCPQGHSDTGRSSGVIWGGSSFQRTEMGVELPKLELFWLSSSNYSGWETAGKSWHSVVKFEGGVAYRSLPQHGQCVSPHFSTSITTDLLLVSTNWW